MRLCVSACRSRSRSRCRSRGRIRFHFLRCIASTAPTMAPRCRSYKTRPRPVPSLPISSRYQSRRACNAFDIYHSHSLARSLAHAATENANREAESSVTIAVDSTGSARASLSLALAGAHQSHSRDPLGLQTVQGGVDSSRAGCRLREREHSSARAARRDCQHSSVLHRKGTRMSIAPATTTVVCIRV